MRKISDHVERRLIQEYSEILSASGDVPDVSMSQAQIDRVREDLAAMRRVLRFRLRFEREHVWANLVLALAGLVVAAVTEWTSISSVPSVRGSGVHWAYIGLVTVPALLALGVLAAVAHRRKDAAPLSCIGLVDIVAWYRLVRLFHCSFAGPECYPPRIFSEAHHGTEASRARHPRCPNETANSPVI